MAYLWVGIGSGIGGILRYGAVLWASQALSPNFPYGTLIVNVLGSTLIGCFAAFAMHPDFLMRAEIRLFLLPGLCGGFTTFSAFSLDTLLLARSGEWGRAGINVAVSTALCLAGVCLGYAATEWLRQR